MKLYKNSWHYKLHKSAYDKNPPNNFCDYFWRLVLAILIFPIALPSHTINFFNKNSSPVHQCVGVIFTVLIILFGVVGVLVVESCGLNINYYDSNFVAFLITYGAGILILVIALGIIFLFDMIGNSEYMSNRRDKRRQRRRDKEDKVKVKKVNFIKEYYRNVKEKNCTIIDWAEEEGK